MSVDWVGKDDDFLSDRNVIAELYAFQDGVWSFVAWTLADGGYEKSLKHLFSKGKRNERTKHCVFYGSFFFALLFMLCASAM